MSDKSEITAIENKRADAILRHDLPVFFNLFSDDFIATNPFNKVVTKEKVFDFFEKGIAGNVSSFDIGIEHISFIKGLAVVMGKETLTSKTANLNNPKTIERRFTNIWVKDNDEWKICVRHASIICA